MYGPFVSYPDNDLPLVTVAGHSVGREAIRVSWSIENSTCYMFDSISVSCGSVVASDGAGNSRRVTGLEPNTEYDCSVSGVWTENSKLMVGTNIEVTTVVTVRTEGV